MLARCRFRAVSLLQKCPRKCTKMLVLALLSLAAGRSVALQVSSVQARCRAPRTAGPVAQAAATQMPNISPTGVENRIWKWRGFNVRYQCLGEEQDGPSVLLIHGLFVNADHWRQNLPALAAAGCRVYAIDLLGSGYSSKPYPTSPDARAISGENGRSLGAPEQPIGSASGDVLSPRPVPQAHPVEGSAYNFFTWAEQIAEFTEEARRARSLAPRRAPARAVARSRRAKRVEPLAFRRAGGRC